MDKKNTTIDRINNNGNYCKKNCRWVSMSVQANNKRNNKIIEINNEKHTLAQWLKIKNLSNGTYNSRVFRDKLSPVEALMKVS